MAGRKKKRRYDRIAYFMIAPNFIIFVTFVLIPIFWSVAMSFTNYNLRTSEFIGFENYLQLFQDSVFKKSLVNTLVYSLLTIVPTMVFGLLLALLLNRAVPLKRFFRTVFYMPNILSVIAVSMAWVYLYNTNAGVLNRLLNLVGLPSVKWISDPKIALFSVVIMSIWMSTGYNMVVFLSGLQMIPTHLYEAAKMDGANAIQQFIKITFPLLSPTTYFLFIMACIQSFQVFGQVYALTGGGPVNATTTIAHQIYKSGFESYRMGYASAMAVVLLLIILILTLLNLRLGKGGESDVT